MERAEYTILISGDDHLVWPPALEELLEKAARAVLESENTPSAEVSLHLTDDAGIRALNRTYRHIDAPTDVLSFGLGPEDGDAPGGVVLLGDVDRLARAGAGAGSRVRPLVRKGGRLPGRPRCAASSGIRPRDGCGARRNAGEGRGGFGRTGTASRRISRGRHVSYGEGSPVETLTQQQIDALLETAKVYRLRAYAPLLRLQGGCRRLDSLRTSVRRVQRGERVASGRTVR